MTPTEKNCELIVRLKTERPRIGARLISELLDLPRDEVESVLKEFYSKEKFQMFNEEGVQFLRGQWCRKL